MALLRLHLLRNREEKQIAGIQNGWFYAIRFSLKCFAVVKYVYEHPHPNHPTPPCWRD